MEAKTVKDSSITLVHAMMPQDANPAGNVHGGVVMKYIDTAAGVVATRHARCNVVTASIERLDFIHPVYIGNLLSLKASLNMVGTSSMEVGVRAETENLRTGEVRHTVSAYLTVVALDESGRPKRVPRLILESEDEKRRNREGLRRREVRLAEKKSESESRGEPTGSG
jgi:acyl-CoA hydrolase